MNKILKVIIVTGTVIALHDISTQEIEHFSVGNSGVQFLHLKNGQKCMFHDNKLSCGWNGNGTQETPTKNIYFGDKVIRVEN